MQPLNAIDAITPAFTRTHEILFQPFRFGRSWKLAASQYLGMLGAFFVPFPLLLLFLPNFSPIPNVARSVIAVPLTLGTLIFFGLFYLCVRMQFVNFEMIVTRATFIAPMWRRYSRRIWPVIAAKTILGTGLSLALAPFLRKSFTALANLNLNMPKITPGVPPDPAMFQAMTSQIIGLEATFFAAIIFLKLFSSAFEDFVMPFYILEDIPLTAALGRAGAVFLADPLHCILYLFLKLVLSIVGFIVQFVTYIIVLIPVAIVGGIVVFLGAFVVGAMGPGGKVLGIVGGVLLYIVFVGGILWYQVGTLGYITTLLEAYATYFLAGRYPLLGSMLESGPGGPFTPPPVFPSEEERRDNDGGPPMPMDPAIA